VNLELSPRATEQLGYWIKTNPRFALKIIELMESARDSPYSGLGKPEPLKYGLKGTWSRRIAEEHRLVYRVYMAGTEETVEIISCRFHYTDR
jgi:toxin YoeB